MTTFYLDPEGGDDFVSDFSSRATALSMNGTVTSSAVAAKYGARSLDFSSGTNAAMRASASATNGLQLVDKKFTAEAWVYFTSHSATTVETMFGQWTDAGASNLSWRVGMNASGQLQYQWSTSGTAAAGALTAAWTPNLNQWYHVAFDRDGTTARLYVDGVVMASVADALPILHANTSTFNIGNDNSNAKRFPGLMQDFRLTAGVARYAGAFTPPAAALPLTPKDDRYFYNVVMFVPGRSDGSGTSFANRWRTIQTGATAARTAPGDTIRIRATPDPTLLGNATWTQNSKTVTLAAAVTANIDTCDVSWTGATNVTASLVTGTARKEGSGYVNLAVAPAFTTGKLAYHATGTLDLSGYQQVNLWFQSNGSQYGGTLRLVLCSDTTGDVPIQSIVLPDYPATGQWQAMVIDTGAALPSNVASVALYADVDPGNANILLDNIFASKASSSADSLTLRSLIGKVHNLSWAPSTSYAVGDRRRPSQANRNGFVYQVASSLAGTAHRYWRLNVSANNGSSLTEIVEFEMHTSPGGANVVSGGTASASSELGSNWTAAKAFDGSTSTFWASSSAAATLQYDFGAGNAKNISEVALRCFPSAEPSTATPKDFTIQYSDDGSSWTTAYTATNQTAWSNNELRTYTFPGSATSGATEPVWPAAWGASVTDGTVVWNCIDRELEDSWFPLTGVNGTTLTLANNTSDSFTSLRGYHGATETVATYKRETQHFYPAPPNFSSINIINESGSLGNPITYSGGWNRTDMSAQDGGETWWDGVNGNGNGFHFSSQKNIVLAYFNGVRFGGGVSMSTGGGGKITNCHMVGCTNGFDLTASNSQWTLSGVHGFNNSQAGVSCSSAGQVFAKAVQGSSNGSGVSNTLGFQLGAYKVRANYVVARNNGSLGIGAPVSPAYDAIVYNYATSSNSTASVGMGNSFSPICYVNGVCGEATFAVASNLNGSAPSDGMLFSHKHGGDVNDHRIYFAEGTIRTDVVTRHTGSGLAWKCSLTNTNRASNYPVRFSLGRYLLQANVTKTFKVWSRRDNANIKGALLIHGGSLTGISDDVQVSVDPTAINTWEQSAGLSVTPTETGVVELWMLWWDGVGTANSYWIDDLTVT